jgi:hypothetical protein
MKRTSPDHARHNFPKPVLDLGKKSDTPLVTDNVVTVVARVASSPFKPRDPKRWEKNQARSNLKMSKGRSA